MYILAIDPGVMNLAVAVVELKSQLPPEAVRTMSLALLCEHTRLAHWQRIDLSAGVRNATHAQLCAELIRQMDAMSWLYSKATAVGIEHQMATNHDANAVQNYALSYFMCRYPGIHVQLIRPLWKTQCLGPLSVEAGVPEHDLSVYSGRKKWSVATILRCRELWGETEAQLYRPPPLNWQFEPETWKVWDLAKPKQDDLADAAVMVLGWLVHSNGKLGSVVGGGGGGRVVRATTIPTTTPKKKNGPTRAQRRNAQSAFIEGAVVGAPTPQQKPAARKGHWQRRRKLVRQ
jgi:hypothetical protein